MGKFTCCVEGCKSSSETQRMFCFPKNNELRKLWMFFLAPNNSLLIGLSTDQLMKKRVCDRHFDQYQFDREGKRLRYSYPCLFTETEIALGIPLAAPGQPGINDHNYSKKPADIDESLVEIEESESVITSDHTYFNIVHDDSEVAVASQVTISPEKPALSNPLPSTTATIPSTTNVSQVAEDQYIAIPIEDEESHISQPIEMELITDPIPVIDDILPNSNPKIGITSTANRSTFGLDIYAELPQLLEPVLNKGLPKKVKNELIKQYPIPANFQSLKAPKINNKSLAIPNKTKQADKKLEAKQKQLGVGISAMSKAMTTLLNSDNKIDAIKALYDGCCILCDLHHTETENRQTMYNSSTSDKIVPKNFEKQRLKINKRSPENLSSGRGCQKRHPCHLVVQQIQQRKPIPK